MGVGVEVVTWTEVGLGGGNVEVNITDGIGVSVGKGTGVVCFVKYLLSGVELRKGFMIGIYVEHARMASNAGSQMKGRIFELIKRD